MTKLLVTFTQGILFAAASLQLQQSNFLLWVGAVVLNGLLVGAYAYFSLKELSNG